MSTIQVESEGDDVFEGIKGRAISRVKEALADTYARDREDVANDLAEALDIEDVPKFSVDIVLRIGKQTVTVSGLTKEEKDENEDDE